MRRAVNAVDPAPPIAFVLAGLVACLPGPVALASPPPEPTRLEYVLGEGAETCPGEAALADAVAARLGRSPFDPDAAEAVRVEVGSTAAGLVARVARVDATGAAAGERVLEAATGDCSDLLDSLVLTISIAIDPLALTRTIPSPETPAPPRHRPEPRPPPAPAPAAAAPAPSPETRTAAWRAGAGVHLALGTAPAAAGGVAAHVGLRWGDLSFAIEGRADLPARGRSRGVQIETSVLLASAVPCVHFTPVLACVVAGAGALRAEGTGLAEPKQVATPWLAIGARLAIEVPNPTPVAFRAHLDTTAHPARTSLLVDDEVVWSSSLLSLTAGVGAALQFP